MQSSFIHSSGIKMIAGVDEAGRGPLAGDVVAAAVILNPDVDIPGLNDSKKLSARKREKLFFEIQEKSLAWNIARATVEEIDAINILQATLLAMKRAVDGLSIAPHYVLVDGNHLPNWNYASEAIIKGDSSVQAISAASILAKVQRDRDMFDLDKNFPGYGFSDHKGYPTTRHLQALSELGVTVVHRRTYAPIRTILEGIK